MLRELPPSRSKRVAFPAMWRTALLLTMLSRCALDHAGEAPCPAEISCLPSMVGDEEIYEQGTRASGDLEETMAYCLSIDPKGRRKSVAIRYPDGCAECLPLGRGRFRCQ